MKRWTLPLARYLVVAMAMGVALVGSTRAQMDEVTEEGTNFHASADARDIVTFTSKAPLEKIVGKAKKTWAHINVKDVANIVGKKTVMATFVVDLTTLDSGITLRDQHMRDNFLHTGQYPKVTFRLNEVVAAYTITMQGEREVKTSVKGLTDGKETFVDAKGTLDLHGVKREITVTRLGITYFKATDVTKNVRPGDLLKVVGSFKLVLGDYKIERPQFLLMKLSNDVMLDFDVTLGTGVEPGKDGMMACGCGACGCGDAKKGCGDAKKGCGDAKKGCGVCK
ncbi:MAG: YceI family protein [Candidatus Poribacteria bacterium]|nr:YceI family protein [Candidatus Poribacteria bacterium]